MKHMISMFFLWCADRFECHHCEGNKAVWSVSDDDYQPCSCCTEEEVKKFWEEAYSEG